MFYNAIVDEWGKTTYVPTTLGNVLLAAAIAALLFAAVLFARHSAGKRAKAGLSLSIRQLAFCAMSVALGTALSYVKVFKFPTGGSITLLSMLAVCLPGYWFGLGAGLMAGVAYGALQALIGPYILYPAQFIVDYLLAYGALGLSGLFSNAKQGLLKGYVAGVAGRYVFAVVSGWIFFGEYAWEGWNPFVYSLAYNAIYIFSEAAVTLAVLAAAPVKKAFCRVKKMAAE